MISRKPIQRGVLAVLCGLMWSGCFPSGPGVTDEEKEPLFLIGRSRVNAMDFGGAIEAFEQALETNPQSAAAHLELGGLYAQQNSDPAAAIYHYEQYLRRRPMAANAEMIRKQIRGLKQALAEPVLLMPPVSSALKMVEDLRKENRQLRADLERLRGDGAVRPGSASLPTGRAASGPTGSASGGSVAGDHPPPPNPGRPASTSTTVRTHKVLSGDTPTSIARRYNIKVTSLLAANPGLNPNRMRIDQSLAIPAR